jgi:hypothetical protein
MTGEKIAFWIVAPLTLGACPLILLFGLAVRRGPAIELPRPSALTPVEFTARVG